MPTSARPPRDAATPQTPSPTNGQPARSPVQSGQAEAAGAGVRSAEAGVKWQSRSLLGLQGLSGAELRTILETARGFSEVATRSVKKVPALRGRVVANLFFEDSTRTRLSFTLAAQRLSADVIDLTSSGSSVSKGETVVDTALNIEAMGVDAMVVRHKASGAPQSVSAAVKCAVVNAGDGKHEHPTQGLLDIYTLAESHKRLDTFDLSGLTVAIVGDIVSSRVARSNIAGLTALGARVVCIGPPTLAPGSLRGLGPEGGPPCEVAHDFDQAMREYEPDAVNMLRIQFERHGEEGTKPRSHEATKGIPGPASSGASGGGGDSPAFPSIREYAQGYALTAERAGRLKPGAVVMHPGPMNRGIEIADEVADGPRSVILRQVANGLSVRMAALYLCVTAGD